VYQIGADEAYLDKPVKLAQLKLNPAERADIIVDFSKLAGSTINVTNSAAGQMFQISDIMQFRVTLRRRGNDNSCYPSKPNPFSSVCASPYPMVRLTDGQGNIAPGVKIDKVRQIVLNENVQFPATFEELQNNTSGTDCYRPASPRSFLPTE